MSNPTVEQLLAWMNGKSRTHGWGAIVAYDRGKANDLLTQLFIERFNSTSYLPPLSESLDHGDSTNVEHVYDLTFAVPQLHFETADLDESRVELSLDFIGGMIVSEFIPAQGFPRIDKLQKVLPLNRPQLTMSVLLGNGEGQVGHEGEVTLDISEGTRFSANFVVGTLSQEEIGSRFKLYFENELDDKQKVYPLGKMEGENGVLTPERFDIRTMPAPGATRRDAENYRDGAIILFVKLKGGTAGGLPGSGSGFMYPIPAAADGKEYSGTMWLSSRILMDELIRKDAESDIGYGITFAPYDGSADVACVLDATAGGLEFPQLEVDVDVNEGIVQSVYIRANWNYMFKSEGAGNSPLTIAPKDNQVDLSWKCAFSTYYAYKRRIEDWWDDYHEGHMACTSDVHIAMAPVLDANGVVHFKASKRSTTLHFKSDRTLPHLTDEHYNGTDLLNHTMHERIFPHFDEALGSLTLPSIDTFLVRNLLFPGQNALQLSDVHVPGDLNLLGHIDPLRTACKVTPLQPTVEAGGTQQFKTEPAMTGVTWSVRATDGADLNVGTIDAKGLYKAAPANELVQGYQRVVVTAKGKHDGQDVTSSAMVSVVETTVSVAPVFQVCGEGQSITLTAETLSGKDPEWSLKNPGQGGHLSVSKGRECIYTPPPLADPDRPPAYMEIVQVKNPDTQAITESVLLVLNHAPSIPVIISEASDPASGKVQLQMVGDQGPMDPEDAIATPYLLYGPGTMTLAGVYTEPANASGFAVVSVVRPKGMLWNFLVIPLPMASYADLIQTVTHSMLNHCTGALPSLND